MFREYLHYFGNRLLRRPAALNYADHAARSEILVPSHSAVRPAAIMLPGNMDRARATVPSTRMEIQKAIAAGGPMVHPATTVHTLRDVLIDQTSLLCDGRRKSLTGSRGMREICTGFGKPLEKFSSGLLISTHQGLTYFGDWLFENNARAFLAGELGVPALSMVRTSPYAHAERYEQLFDLNIHKVQRAQVAELMIVDDWGHPSVKAARYRQLRERAQRISGRRKGHGVYVVRGRTGEMRYLENEDQCIEWAQRRDFTILDPTTLSVDEIVAEMRDARYVVGVEGSGLLHGLLSMAPDGFALGIVAADRFVVSSKEYADALHIPMALLVADQGSLHGFRVDLDELDATFTMACASI